MTLNPFLSVGSFTGVVATIKVVPSTAAEAPPLLMVPPPLPVGE